MIERLRLAWNLARVFDADTLAELWRMVRIHGVPVAARFLARAHTTAIHRRLELDLGEPPTERDLRAAEAGAVGIFEGLT